MPPNYGIWGFGVSTEPQKASLHGNTSYNVQIVKIGPPVRPVRVHMIPKKQRNKPYSDKLAIRPDHLAPTWSDRNTAWHGCWSSNSSHLVLSASAEWVEL